MLPPMKDSQRLFLLPANRHRSRLVLSFIVALLLSICPTVGRAQNSVPQVTAVPVANLYSTPSRDADVVSQSVFGQELQVLQEKTDWLRVRTPDQYMGWTLRDSVRPSAPSHRIAQVSSIFANVYRETDVTAHQPLLTLPFEARVEVVARLGAG
jgi:dipeptidyl peptidase-like protein